MVNGMQVVTAIGGHSKRPSKRKLSCNYGKIEIACHYGLVEYGGDIDTMKGEWISFGVEMAGAERQQGSSLKLRCQNADYMVNTGIG